MNPEARQTLQANDLDRVRRIKVHSQLVWEARLEGQWPEVLRWLAGQDYPLTRTAALANPGLPVDLMLTILDSGVLADRLRMLENPGLPVEVLQREANRLLDDPASPESSASTAELEVILSSERVGSELLKRGVWSGVPGWAAAAAGNPTLPESVAVQVLRRGTIPMRARVAANPGVGAWVAVAAHDWSTERSAKVLLAAVYLVRGDARARVLARLVTRGVTGRREVAGKSADPDTVVVLAHDADPETAMAAAGNRVLPAGAAEELLRTGGVLVRANVVGNPAVPDAVLTAHDWAAETSSAVLIAALWRVTGPVRELVLDLLAVSDTSGRLAAAKMSRNPATVTVLCGDPEAHIRAAAVANPVVTEEGRICEVLLR